MAVTKSKEIQFEHQLRQHLEEEACHEISMSDIVRTDYYLNNCAGKEGTRQACTKEDLYNILYSLGMDTSKNIEEQVLPHRNWQNEVVTCLRFVGYKRTDKDWKDYIKNGVSWSGNN